MGFATPAFFVYLAGLMLGYFLIPKRYRWMALLAGSYVYILLNGWHTALFLLLASAIAFGAALAIEREQRRYAERLQKNRSQWPPEEKKAQKRKAQKRKRAWLAAALTLIVGMLAALKYANFGIRNVNAALAWLHAPPISQVNWLLPLGISFYTLQISGYVIDVYRGKYAAERRFLRFLLFCSWFPQLLQGPISRFDALASQLFEGHDFCWRRAKSGALRMLWGYFKKLVIADRLALVVVPLFAGGGMADFNGAYTWLAVILYSFQIYADFSGGMDIALGISEIFGVTLAENFRRPLLAGSVAEFWQRWHITLGSWMRDYLFYPLALSRGFNRLGKRLRKRFGPYVAKVAPACLASLMVFLCVGVWHGAEWKYFVYGCYHAVFVSSATLLEPFYERVRARLHIRAQSAWFQCFRVLRTFGIVAVGRLLSRADTLSAASNMLRRGLGACQMRVIWDGGLLAFGLDGANWIALGLAVALWMAVDMLNERGLAVRERLEKQALPVRWAAYILGVLVVLVFGVYGAGINTANFIYGQF